MKIKIRLILLLILVFMTVIFGGKLLAKRVAEVKKISREQEEEEKNKDQNNNSELWGKKDSSQSFPQGSQSPATTQSSTPQSGQPAPNKDEYNQKMLAAAKKYWTEKYGDDGTQIELRNYGCHTGVEVKKNGAAIANLIYDGTNITEVKI